MQGPHAPRVASARGASVERGPPDAVMRAIVEASRDLGAIRVLAWTFLRGRLIGKGPLPDRVQGLRAIADRIEPHVTASREEIAWLIVTASTVGFGFAISGCAYLRALGHTPTTERDDRLRTFLGDLLRERLFRAQPTKGSD
jgi:hypothetical protein